MPIFEYRCIGCGGRYEALRTRADLPPPACSVCGGVDVERLVSAFAVGRPATDSSASGPCGSNSCACRNDG